MNHAKIWPSRDFAHLLLRKKVSHKSTLKSGKSVIRWPNQLWSTERSASRNVSTNLRKTLSFLPLQVLRTNFRMKWLWQLSHWDLPVSKFGCWREIKWRQQLVLQSRLASSSADSRFSTWETSIRMLKQTVSYQTSSEELTPYWWLMEAHWMWYCRTKVLRNAFSIVPHRRHRFAFAVAVPPKKP